MKRNNNKSLDVGARPANNFTAAHLSACWAPNENLLVTANIGRYTFIGQKQGQSLRWVVLIHFLLLFAFAIN